MLVPSTPAPLDSAQTWGNRAEVVVDSTVLDESGVGEWRTEALAAGEPPFLSYVVLPRHTLPVEAAAVDVRYLSSGFAGLSHRPSVLARDFVRCGL